MNTSDQHLYCLFLHLLLFFILSQPLFFPSFIPSLISFNIHFSVRLFFVFFCFHFSLLHLFFLPLLLHHLFLFLFLFLFLSTTTSFLSPLPPSPLTPQPPPLSLSPSPLTPEPPLPFLLLHLFLPPSPYSSPCHHGRSKAEKTWHHHRQAAARLGAKSARTWRPSQSHLIFQQGDRPTDHSATRSTTAAFVVCHDEFSVIIFLYYSHIRLSFIFLS